MGLAERKLVAAIKDTDFKEFETKIKELCGFDIKITFDWTMVENHSECSYICNNKKYNDFVFDPLVKVFTTICSDNMGKEAVKEKLKEVIIIPGTGELEFNNGIFTIRNDLTGNGAWSESQMQEILEKGL